MSTQTAMPRMKAKYNDEIRDQLKAELTRELTGLYPEEVLDSYFVEFVTQ